MEVLITILTLISFILILFSIILTNKLINQFKEENRDLRFEVVKYARKIKRIEDIIKQDKSKNEFAIITLQNIKKELFTDTNQEK